MSSNGKEWSNGTTRPLLRSPRPGVHILAILVPRNPWTRPQRRKFAWELNSAVGNMGNALVRIGCRDDRFDPLGEEVIQQSIVGSTAETIDSILLARRSRCSWCTRVTAAAVGRPSQSPPAAPRGPVRPGRASGTAPSPSSARASTPCPPAGPLRGPAPAGSAARGSAPGRAGPAGPRGPPRRGAGRRRARRRGRGRWRPGQSL